MSVKKTIVALCVILYTAGQASSFKCYVCSSTYGEDCYKNPKKPEFEKNCPETGNSTFRSPNISVSSLADDSGTGGVSYASTTHDCCAVKGTILGIEGVIRSCQLKTLSEEDIKKAATAAGMTVKSFERCENDLCNTSDAPTTTSSVPPVISSTQSPSPSTKPSPDPTTKPAPITSTTHAPNSSETLSIAFLSLAGYMYFVYFIKL